MLDQRIGVPWGPCRRLCVPHAPASTCVSASALVHAGDSSSLPGAVVCDLSLPGDVQYATETAHVERIKLLFLSGSQGPGLTAIQENAEGTGSVDLDFGVFNHLLLGSYSLCQPSELAVL